MQEAFNKLIALLAERIGLDALKPTPDGICNLFFDGLPMTLLYLSESNSVLLFSSLGKLPDQGREDFCLKLLEANHFFNGTGGATLSVHRASGLVALHQVMPLRMLDEARFLQFMETYMNTAEHWAKACTEHDAPKPPPDVVNRPSSGWVPA